MGEMMLNFLTKHIHTIGFTWLGVLVIGILVMSLGINPLYWVAGSSNEPVIEATPTEEPLEVLEEPVYGDVQTYQSPANKPPVKPQTVTAAPVQPIQSKTATQQPISSLKTDNSSQYQARSYPQCRIDYAFSFGTETRTYTHLSPDECKVEQEKIANITKPEDTSTVSQPTAVPQQPVNYVQQCRDNATSRYQSGLQECNRLSNSTRQGCLEIYSRQHQEDLISCE